MSYVHVSSAGDAGNLFYFSSGLKSQFFQSDVPFQGHTHTFCKRVQWLIHSDDRHLIELMGQHLRRDVVVPTAAIL